VIRPLRRLHACSHPPIAFLECDPPQAGPVVASRILGPPRGIVRDLSDFERVVVDGSRVILHFEFRADAERWRVRVPETVHSGRTEPDGVQHARRGRSIGEYRHEVGPNWRVDSIYDATSFYRQARRAACSSTARLRIRTCDAD